MKFLYLFIFLLFSISAFGAWNSKEINSEDLPYAAQAGDSIWWSGIITSLTDGIYIPANTDSVFIDVANDTLIAGADNGDYRFCIRVGDSATNVFISGDVYKAGVDSGGWLLHGGDSSSYWFGCVEVCGPNGLFIDSVNMRVFGINGQTVRGNTLNRASGPPSDVIATTNAGDISSFWGINYLVSIIGGYHDNQTVGYTSRCTYGGATIHGTRGTALGGDSTFNWRVWDVYVNNASHSGIAMTTGGVIDIVRCSVMVDCRNYLFNNLNYWPPFNGYGYSIEDTTHVYDSAAATYIDPLDGSTVFSAINDGIVFGYGAAFTGAVIWWTEVGTTVTPSMEFWNGSAWQVMGTTTDNTSGMTTDGTVTWSYAHYVDSGWATSTIDGVEAYYIRMVRTEASVTGTHTIDSVSIILRSNFCQGQANSYNIGSRDTDSGSTIHDNVLWSGEQHYGSDGAILIEANRGTSTNHITVYNNVTDIHRGNDMHYGREVTAKAIAKVRHADVASRGRENILIYDNHSAVYDTATNGYVEGLDDVTLFENRYDGFVVGMNQRFKGIEVFVNDGSGDSVVSTFQYTNSDGDWIEFSLKTNGDETGGFKSDGDINWSISGGTAWQPAVPDGSTLEYAFYIRCTVTGAGDYGTHSIDSVRIILHQSWNAYIDIYDNIGTVKTHTDTLPAYWKADTLARDSSDCDGGISAGCDSVTNYKAYGHTGSGFYLFPHESFNWDTTINIFNNVINTYIIDTGLYTGTTDPHAASYILMSMDSINEYNIYGNIDTTNDIYCQFGLEGGGNWWTTRNDTIIYKDTMINWGGYSAAFLPTSSSGHYKYNTIIDAVWADTSIVENVLYGSITESGLTFRETMTITVVDGDSNPVEDAIVKIVNAYADTVIYDTTDGTGIIIDTISIKYASKDNTDSTSDDFNQFQLWVISNSGADTTGVDSIVTANPTSFTLTANSGVFMDAPITVTYGNDEIDDTYIYESTPTFNRGTSSSGFAKTVSPSTNFLFLFNVDFSSVPSNVIVTGAICSLKVGALVSSYNFEIHQILTSYINGVENAAVVTSGPGVTYNLAIDSVSGTDVPWDDGGDWGSGDYATSFETYLTASNGWIIFDGDSLNSLIEGMANGDIPVAAFGAWTNEGLGDRIIYPEERAGTASDPRITFTYTPQSEAGSASAGAVRNRRIRNED